MYAENTAYAATRPNAVATHCRLKVSIRARSRSLDIRTRPYDRLPMIVPRIHTRLSLTRDLDSLGIRAGDIVMVHAAMKRVGRLLNGPDVLIEALRDAVGAAGTIVAYTDWNGAYDALLDENGRVPPEWRAHIAPFDPAVSRAARDNGVLAEFIRTTPGEDAAAIRAPRSRRSVPARIGSPPITRSITAMERHRRSAGWWRQAARF